MPARQQHLPAPRRCASGTAEAYGAPYTNSVTFEPLPSSADSFVLRVRAPGYAAADVELLARDSVGTVVRHVQTATGAGSVALVRNGAPVPAAALPPVSVADLFDSCVELVLDGVR